MKSEKLSSVRRFVSRLAQTLLTLLGASVLIWALLPLAPGDPALRTLQALGNDNPRPAEVAALRAELQLGRPLPLQYMHWLTRALRGDLARSWQSGQPVRAELGKRIGATALLAIVTLLLAIVLALTLALIAAAFVQRRPDTFVRSLTQAGAAVPGFLLGLLLLQFVVIRFGVGRVVATGTLNDVWLPALCLACGRAAEWAQLLRAGLLEALGARYSLVAAARGASRWRVLWRYALPSALLPWLAVLGTGLGALLGGVAVIETVFSWPGLGSLAVAALAARDLPVLQGYVLLCTLVYVAASGLSDVLSERLDPRWRVQRAA